MSTRVLVADDGELHRAGLIAMLETDRDIEVVGEVAALDELVSSVQALAPDVLLLDLRWFVDEQSALILVPQLKKAQPVLRIVTVSAHERLVLEASRSKADAALVKTFTREELLKAVHGHPHDDRRLSLAPDDHVTVSELADRIAAIPVGVAGARDYEVMMSSLLMLVWGSYLTSFKTQCTASGAGQIWDCVALNESEHSFWAAMRQTHGAIQVLFEFKNVAHLKPTHVNQVGNYLADALSRFGIIITRNDVSKTARATASRLFREEGKVVVILTDRDIIDSARLLIHRDDPMQAVRNAYLMLTRKLPM